MIIELSNNLLDKIESHQFSLFQQKVHQGVSKSIKKLDGRIVQSDNESYLVSFKSVTNAVLCALRIQQKFKYIIPKFEKGHKDLKIGISCGLPVTNKGSFFEEAVLVATNLCKNVKEHIAITSEVKDLYESENRNAIIDKDLIRTLKPSEEKFLQQIMKTMYIFWNQSSFSTVQFAQELGYSKSQLYRKLLQLTGKTPNSYLREYRLEKALELLHQQSGNISEIAYETGFNSPTYFSKCFFDSYGILPSTYIHHYIT